MSTIYMESREARVRVIDWVAVSEGQQGKRVSHVIFDQKGDQHSESPSGHWSPQAVLVNRTVYISGQLGMGPASGELVPGGVAEETKQALTDLGEILKSAGCGFTYVVKQQFCWLT